MSSESYGHARNMRLIEEGLCTNCMQPNPHGGWYCDKCSAIKNASSKAWRDRGNGQKKERDRRLQIRETMRSIRESKGNACSVCGETNPACLCLHHIDPSNKLGGIGILLDDHAPMGVVLAEADKCELLCSNCHYEIHASSSKHKDSVRHQAIKRTLIDEHGGKCSRCGYEGPNEVLNFHHAMPGKRWPIKAAIHDNRPLSDIREELKLCILVCANCHRKIHSEERNNGQV